MKKNHCRTAIAALALALLAGCVNLKRQYADVKLYTLEAAPEVSRPPADAGPAVKVQGFRAAPGLETSEFIYRTGDSSYETDFYNTFFVFPADQVRGLTVRWLQASGAARLVFDRPSNVQPAYAVEGYLSDLHGDFRDRKNPRAVIALDFLLVDLRPVEPRIVFSGSYREEVPIPEADAAALVKGWEEGSRKILAAFTEAFETALEKEVEKPE